MDQLVLTNSQLEQFTEIFVNEFCVEKTETSKIIAGMTAIIDGNEAALDQMKNQKWFQRIWYTITGKNKATVREMQLRRDEFSKFTIMVINRLLNMTSCNFWMIENLSSAFTIIRTDMAELEISVNELAHRLNEKIESIDNYNNIITDIQNDQYNTSTPFLSFLDILSQVDYLIYKDPSKLARIKATMKKNGFRFDSYIDATSFADDILSMLEENVGRIYLFCQKFSSIRCLNYACRLIENYFYQSDINRVYVLRDGSVVRNAMNSCGISSQTSYRLEDLFEDLEFLISSSFDAFSKCLTTTPSSCAQMSYSSDDGCIICGNASVSKYDFKRFIDYALKRKFNNAKLQNEIFLVRIYDGISDEELDLLRDKSISNPVLFIDADSAEFESESIQYLGNCCNITRECCHVKILMTLPGCHVDDDIHYVVGDLAAINKRFNEQYYDVESSEFQCILRLIEMCLGYYCGDDFLYSSTNSEGYEIADYEQIDYPSSASNEYESDCFYEKQSMCAEEGLSNAKGIVSGLDVTIRKIVEFPSAFEDSLDYSSMGLTVKDIINECISLLPKDSNSISYNYSMLSSIPEKIQKAKQKYAYGSTGEVLGLVDTSLFKNGASGLLFTSEGVAFDNSFDKYFVRYDEIYSISISKEILNMEMMNVCVYGQRSAGTTSIPQIVDSFIWVRRLKKMLEIIIACLR